MIRYLVFALISSYLVATANGAQVGEGFCRDSQNRAYKVVGYAGVPDAATACPSPAFCGRPEVTGYEYGELMGQSYCNCLFDAFFTVVTIPPEMFTNDYYAPDSTDLDIENPGSGPITGVQAFAVSEITIKAIRYFFRC